MIKQLLYIPLLALIFFVSCSQNNSSETTIHSTQDSLQQSVTPTTEVEKETIYTTVIFLSDSLSKVPSYGYDVLMDGNKFIHQPYIPSISGNKGFSSKEKAEATAQLVIFKLKNNIMPPSVSPKELDSLGVLK